MTGSSELFVPLYRRYPWRPCWYGLVGLMGLFAFISSIAFILRGRHMHGLRGSGVKLSLRFRYYGAAEMVIT